MAIDDRSTVSRKPRLEWLIDRAELVSAIILSISAMLTAWSSYQSTLWDGDQAAAYTQAGVVRTMASRREIQAGQLEGADILLFTQWLDAHASGERDLEAFYLARFRPEYRVAHDAWLATQPLQNPDAPRTPFATSAYRLPAREEGEALERWADGLFNDGERANRISDDFVRSTVIFASAMFFGGIMQVFRRGAVRLIILGMAILQCIWGVFSVAGLPVN